MDMEQAGAAIALELSEQSKGASIRYGRVLGRRDDGGVTVEVDGGAVAARAMASFDVGAAIGRTAMLVDQGGVLTVMGTMADLENSHDFSDAVEQIKSANAGIDRVQHAVDKVGEQAKEAAAKADAAAGAADRAAEDAGAAGKRADALAGQVTDVQVSVQGMDGRLDRLSTEVSGAASTAAGALAAASRAQQDVDGFKTTVSQTYQTKADAGAAMAKEVLDRNSAISQSASKVLTEVSQKYVDNETGETFATKSDLSQTAAGIESTVSQRYQPKGDYATGGELGDAIAGEVLARDSAIRQSADAIRGEVAESYVDKATGETFATKSQLTQTAGEIRSEVAENYVDKDTGATYATKTELKQTGESLTVTIEQAASAAGAAQSTADSAQAAAGAAQSRADSAFASAATANSAANDAQGAANSAQSTADGAVAGLNVVKSYMEFDADGLHVGKRATSADGSEYQTAETLMGTDGSFAIVAPDGTTVARLTAEMLSLVGGRFGVGVQKDDIVLVAANPGDGVRIATDNAGEVLIYCNDNNPQNGSCVYLKEQYALLGAQDGESIEAGSGAYFLAGMSGQSGVATICADRLGLRPRGGQQVNVDMSRAAAILGGRRMWTGSVVLAGNGGRVQRVWTAETFAASFGAYVQGQTHVSFTCGDAAAASTAPVCFGRRSGDGAMCAVFPEAVSGSYRIDYAVWN